MPHEAHKTDYNLSTSKFKQMSGTPNPYALICRYTLRSEKNTHSHFLSYLHE